MTNFALVLLSILSGGLILLQSSLNGQLSKYTQNPFFSSFVLYFFSAVFMIVIFLSTRLKAPSIQVLKGIPLYLWITGSILSIIGLTLVYWLMPILGVSKVLSGIITGQIITGMIVSHFGFFELPVIEINRYKVLGVAFLFTGVYLINWSAINESIK
ncbi:DMT family transporter [Halobacteriovorax sp. GFR7]|uniref:DMT family transporter n=1 Tax=unclassified Halobacteriovorax TaxID=2639665 RepID=UPI003D96D807